MIWRFFILPFGLSFLFLVISLFALGVLVERESEYLRTVKELQIEVVRSQTQGLFQTIQGDINSIRDRYNDIHLRVQKDVMAGSEDLKVLHQRLMKDLDLHIDLFLIGADLVIFDTTFEPDMGLDFNGPFFKDAQAAFARAKQTDAIDISPLTRELVSGDFKVYTLSQLPDGNYLQLGFVDPNLPERFEQAEVELAALNSIEKASIYHDAGGELLHPMTSSISSSISGVTDKSEMLIRMRTLMAEEMLNFSQVDANTPLAVEAADRSGSVDLYLELGRYRVSDQDEYRYLAKVETNLKPLNWFGQYLSLIDAILVSLGFALMFWFLARVRRLLLIPLAELSKSIGAGQPLVLPKGTGIPDEIQYLVRSFNLYLKKSINLTEELRERSIRDPLTGLLNRNEMVNLFEQSKRIFQRENLSMGVAFIDLDHFKAYNDIYGHSAGDAALVKFSACVQDVFQRPTDRIFRYGGEEFVVLFGCKDPLDAIELAETLREGFQRLSIPHQGNPPFDALTLSCGLVVCKPDLSIELTRLLKQADHQLYASKSNDRNCVTYLELLQDNDKA